MTLLSEEGRRVVGEVAARHGVSQDAVTELLRALAAGYGTQAQFNHPDLGGMGQWSQGGMTMVGDMFNNSLKARVDALCTELSGLLRNERLFVARPAASQLQIQGSGGGIPGVSLFVSGGSTWWPDTLGSPSSSGAQNNLRYAFFPAAHRLAIDIGGKITIYDTGEHMISGVSQQQSGDQSLTLTSQLGLVSLSDLPIVTPATTAPAAQPTSPEKTPESSLAEPAAVVQANPSPAVPSPEPKPAAQGSAPAPAVQEADIFAMLERLATLHEKGILTQAEFEAKKAELLARI
ncbi:MAG: SHOCT domain-containing protein [Rhodobacteraceae bacterium]|nr:SHOCT domain-containing protein [Paracoccaceae bacterium]